MRICDGGGERERERERDRDLGVNRAEEKEAATSFVAHREFTLE